MQTTADNSSLPSHPDKRRLAVVVRGVVQGVGFRPFVYGVAHSLDLTGWVQNRLDRVRIEIEGQPERLDQFLDQLRHHHPPQASLDSIEIIELPPGQDQGHTPDGSAPFEIRLSETTETGF